MRRRTIDCVHGDIIYCKPVLIISMRIYEHTNMYVIFRSVDQNLVLPEVLNKIDQFSNI